MKVSADYKRLYAAIDRYAKNTKTASAAVAVMEALRQVMMARGIKKGGAK